MRCTSTDNCHSMGQGNNSLSINNSGRMKNPKVKKMKNMTTRTMEPSKGLALLDQAVAEGRDFIDPSWVIQRAEISKQAANDLLLRLVHSGLLERVSHGKYAVRPLGVLGVPVAADDVGVAVAALFEGVLHRLAYRSALDYYGLLTRPVRTVQVASSKRIRQDEISDRPLHVILESERTVLVGAAPLKHGSHVSGLERALLDAASRPNLVGGIETVVEALSLAPSIKPARLRSLANQLSARRGLRRLGSLLDQLGQNELANSLYRPGFRHPIELEPKAGTEVQFVDDKWRVLWNVDRVSVLGAATQ